MASDSEKGSRLSRKSFGVTNRIWLIVSLFLFIILFTRLIQHADPDTASRVDFSQLRPKNYLNGSEAQTPFEFCPTYGPGDALSAKYGAVTLAKTRLHLGSGARIQRIVRRAMTGQPMTVSVIGGSVSACHGAGDDPLAPRCYPSRFFQWWNSIFPHPASELTNGAMRRTNSDYFGYCNGHHIPDNVDLIIIELDVDDAVTEQSFENFELLVRSILMRPDQPGIIILGHFSPQTHQTYAFSGPDHWHNVVAQFYDVPHISTKPILYPDYIADPTSIQKYYADPVLANPSGHELLADVLIAYLQTQICSAWNAGTGRSIDILPVLAGDAPKQPTDARGLFGGIGQRKGAAAGSEDVSDGKVELDLSNAIYSQMRVPQARINTRTNDAHAFEEIAPYCVSANDLINPLPPSLFYGSGWYAHHPPTGSNSLQTSAHYWYSTLPTSKIRIPVKVGAGDIGVYYLRESRSEVGQEGSAVECWVDDNYGGAREIRNAADIGEATPTLEIIDHFVTRGSHYVECRLMGEEGRSVPAFKIMGIFST
ncbi:CAP64-like protein [Gloeophyllum trabeum ATCC 11539]|uniref:CAP64-like protein n=1 Tax=Gloeophyllum trabeum (strain ATCC 11539 / FP-39264 / Madison 617) TaxID=670483 RepID=S7PSH7_GLOTA|nr:CAP64-like protein [Gloeophyllum trabeum ATCC 11539]EPQ50771.1 CAP64-like protein [Gloeophyllum trabeum ATCC 11539]